MCSIFSDDIRGYSYGVQRHFQQYFSISWRSVLLVEETGESHRPAASHWQTYPWSFVTHVFHSGHPSHGGDRKSDYLNLVKRDPWFSSVLYSINPLSMKFWWEPQALAYRINWEIYTPYAGAAGMLLHINGKFTMEKLKSSLLS